MKKFHNYEILRFIKKYIKLALTISLIVGLIIAGLNYFIKTNNITEDDKIGSVESETHFDNDSRMAYFRFYLEKPDGDPFRNFGTVQELFSKDDMYGEVLREVQIDLEAIENDVHEENGELDFSSVNVVLDDTNNIYVAIFETGNNSSNIKVAKYYYDLLFNDEIEVLNNLNIYSITSPQLIKMTTDSEIDEEGGLSENSSGLKEIILYFIIGFTGSLVLVIIIVILSELYSKKLNFSFTYVADETNDFIVVDNNQQNFNLISTYIGRPFGRKKILVSEEQLSTHIKTMILGNKSSQINYNNPETDKIALIEKETLDNLKLNENYTEVIIVVLSGQTSRKWYESQLMLCQLYKLPIKTIQINL